MYATYPEVLEMLRSLKKYELIGDLTYHKEDGEYRGLFVLKSKERPEEGLFLADQGYNGSLSVWYEGKEHEACNADPFSLVCLCCYGGEMYEQAEEIARQHGITKLFDRKGIHQFGWEAHAYIE